MPTTASRAISIIDAILNTSSTVTQQQRVAAAFALPTDITNAMKSATFLAEVRGFIVDRVKFYETAQATASVAATTQSTVTTDFTEAP